MPYEEIDIHPQGEHHVNVKAEIGVMPPQAKDHQRFPTTHQKLGGMEHSLSQPSEETNTTDTLILDF